MACVRRHVLAAIGVLALALAAGCNPHGQSPGPEPTNGVSASQSPTLPPVGVACRDLSTQGLTLHLHNAAGLEIAAVEFGAGSRGVVLAHQSDADMCQWLRYAIHLSELGYRVVAFDFAGFGSSEETTDPTYVDDIRTAVDYLRRHNTTRVVVVGASMGATMGIVAAAAITPPMAGVVAVSPPASFAGFNAERAAPELEIPALYIAGETDGDYEVYAREISEATPAELSHLLVVDSPEHGVELVGASTQAGAQVRAAIEEFLDERLRPPATPTTR